MVSFARNGMVCSGQYGRKRTLTFGDQTMEKQLKIIVEKHPDGYIAYPLGLKGIVVGQGDSYQAVLDDVRSAVAFHVQTFGEDSITEDSPVIEAFVAEAAVAF